MRPLIQTKYQPITILWIWNLLKPNGCTENQYVVYMYVRGKTTHGAKQTSVCVYAHSRTHLPRTLTHTMRYCKWASRMYSFARRPPGGEAPAGGEEDAFLCSTLRFSYVYE